MPISIPWYKKVWSYLFAILIQKVNSQHSPDVELVLFHNQLMLTTTQAMYSYGVKYAPFQLAFAYLHSKKLLNPHQFLLLGGALLSASQILHHQYKKHPNTTVVELDGKYEQIIQDYLPPAITDLLTYHHADAQSFMQTCTDRFDLIGIDIFIELAVPDFCLSTVFLNQCANGLTPNGIIIMNTHFKVLAEKNLFEQTFTSVFKQVHIIPHGNNYIFIGNP
jgi:spermidine synthase